MPSGRGVCGAAFAAAQTTIVDDVVAYPGHIACDSASRSEIVIPLLCDGRVGGVFDIDPGKLGRNLRRIDVHSGAIKLLIRLAFNS